MDIILIHIGGEVPEYLYTCVNQIRKYCDNRILIYAPQAKKILKDIQGIPNVLLFGTIPLTDNWEKFNRVQQLTKYGLNNFWKYACERFYAIESIMDTIKIDKAIHIENDNLIYGEPEIDWLNKYCGDSIGLTRITDLLVSAGIMYVGSLNKLRIMNDELNSLLQLPAEALLAKYGNSMINEMYLLHIISINEKHTIKILPIAPDSYSSKYIYDCASWGQYIGGTHQFPNIPYSERRHIIGELIEEKSVDIYFKTIDGHKKPFVFNKLINIEMPLFNLHIHSKNLSKWV